MGEAGRGQDDQGRGRAVADQPSSPKPRSQGRYAQVIVDIRGGGERGLERAFTYSVPQRLVAAVQVGSYVLVPFGKQRLPGYVIGFTSEKPPVRLRDIIATLVDEPVFGEPEADLAEWIARRYLCSPADALRLLLPPGKSQKVLRRASATAAGRQAYEAGTVDRAPRQKQVLGALLDAPLEFEELRRTIAGTEKGVKRAAVSSALDRLEERGYATQTRELQRPAASTVHRQVAHLAETDEPWEEVLAQLAARAPRQAEVIEELMAADDAGVPVAELNRSAVSALQEKGLVAVEEEAIRRAPYSEAWEGAGSEFLRLTPDQQRIYDDLSSAVDNDEFLEVLIHGVTGSGKTEIYLHCISKALKQGKSAIVLVPEISLTPQMVGRFEARFGPRLALQHSALGVGERFDEWQRAATGEASIVIGARSAVFAPLYNLGVIIVDEEYDPAYKQDSTPRYNAVEVARQRAKAAGAVLVLGSATPSIECYYAARASEAVELMELPQRIDNRPMPAVKIIDLRGEVKTGTGTTFSQELLEGLEARLAAGEQSMLFLNRRGFSTFLICRNCGYTPRCPDCAVSLTHHYGEEVLKCHHCDYRMAVPEKCPECGDLDVGFLGLGTERVADQVQRAMPEARVVRMDRDTTTTRGAYGKILGMFARGEADILVGTQMIATGHDFPNLTLVGVLNADTGLHRPDFRAAERTFQLLTQVAGRPGRAEKPGQVLVQTYNADHYAIRTAATHDYVAFYALELESRRRSLYPPFVELVRLVITCQDQEKGWLAAQAVAVALDQQGVYHRKGDEGRAEEMHFAGPAECALRKLRGRYRFGLLLKGPDSEQLAAAVGRLLAKLKLPQGVGLNVDVGPLNMM